MKIGILQTGHVPDQMMETSGDYAAMFRRLLDGHGFTFETWEVVDGQFPSGPEAADAWLITGSKHGAYEDHPWIPPLETLIRAIRDSGRPMVGVCFGHQIIAQAMGGVVEKFTGGWAIGRKSYGFADGTATLNAWHQDQIITPPPQARLLASSDTCKYAALAYGDHVFTMQPHPEFNRPEMQGLLRIKGAEVLSDDEMQVAQDGLTKPVDNARMADRITNFYQRVPA